MASLRDIKKRVINVKAVGKMAQSMKAISSSRLAVAKAQRYGNSKYFQTSYDVSSMLLYLYKKSKNTGLSSNLHESMFVEENPKDAVSVSANKGDVKQDNKVNVDANNNPFASNNEKPSSPKTFIIYITSERGLCGAYNASVLKVVNQRINELGLENVVVCPIGAKAIAFANKIAKGKYIDFKISSDMTKVNNDNVTILAEYLCSCAKTEVFSKVEVIYTHSESVLSQVVKKEVLLPIAIKSFDDTHVDANKKHSHEDVASESINKITNTRSAINNKVDNSDVYKDVNIVTDEFLFERSFSEVLKGYFITILYDKLTDAMIAEHASRLNAMNNANDNCKELTYKLQLEYNKTRQAMITKELIEIISGSESV